jgi:Flp pilus assembly protein TadG
MSLVRRFSQSGSGQAVLEVALVAPFLLALMIGIIDLGRASQFDTQLAAAARAGVQYGAQNLVTADDVTGMENAAKNDAAGLTGISAVASNYCQCAGSASVVTCSATGCSSTHRLLYVTVTASATFHPVFKWLMGGAATRSRTATLQVGQ